MELYSFVNVVKGTSNVVPTLNGGYSKRAYVTFLVGNGDYVKGVVALAKCLRKVKSAYPLVVAIMLDVPEDDRKALRCQGCVVHDIIEPICPPESQIPIERIHSEALYSKLCVWTLEKYNKMIYLDADILVVDNIDHLFDLPTGYFYAVPDCFCENTWSHSPQYSIGYCQLCPNKARWPTEMGSPLPLYFNSGFLVFEPSCETYQNMLNTLQITPPGIFPDQDFLNIFFKNIFKPISMVYNLVLPILWYHPENVEHKKVEVVHYYAVVSDYGDILLRLNKELFQQLNEKQ
ncbi:hypothetical protein ACSBR1_035346 [Camellia fascicularis]